MIIIDTNVWVSFFKGEKKALPVKDMIIDNQSLMHPYVYGELLLGGISEKAEIMLSALDMTTVSDELIIYQFIKKEKLKSKGIGWVDVNILITALVNKHQVYTFDENLLKICTAYNCSVR